jgi:hypothetical protein
MGKRVILDKFREDCTSGTDEDAIGTVHGFENHSGDDATICGIYPVDEVVKYHTTNKPISCSSCIATLESRGSFSRKAKGWY